MMEIKGVIILFKYINIYFVYYILFIICCLLTVTSSSRSSMLEIHYCFVVRISKYMWKKFPRAKSMWFLLINLISSHTIRGICYGGDVCIYFRLLLFHCAYFGQCTYM